ncbi:MAG: serine/threonine-protein kinase [Planctomycetota bacterium]
MTDNDPGRSPTAAGRIRALVEAAWRQAEALRQAEQEAGSTAALPEGTVFAGPPPDSFTGYRILREVHRGGQGVVYQAIQESTQRKVAIKVMREGPFAGAADRARFDREVHVLGQLQHPHIVTIHDTGSAAGHLYFVMDYIPGQPLDVYIAGPEHTAEETLKLFGKICEAVNAAHLRGVIHRDLKPGNIRIDPDGEPHILDFGLAKVAASPADSSGMTLTGQFVGSLPWASPEQAEGAPAKVDVRTDVYSLGVILYQMLTGRFPYEVIGPMRNVLDNILTVQPARPSTMGWHGRPGRGINDEVDTIVLKCLQKERERRYQTAGELARDVGHYLAGEPIEAKRDSTAYILRKQFKRFKIPVAVAATFVVVLTVGLVFSLRSWQTAVQERDRAAEVTRFMQQMLSGINPEVARGQDTSLMRLILDDAAQRIDEELLDRPEIEATLRSTIGSTYTAIGEYTLAEPHLEAALRIRSATLGRTHLDTLVSMSELAQLRFEQGRYDEALDLLETTLEHRRRILGQEHPDTLRTMSELGWLLFRGQRQIDRAEALFRQALDAQRRLLGAEHRDTLASMSNLGLLFDSRGDGAPAEELLRPVLETARRTLGEHHPGTLYAMNNLSLPLGRQGKLDEAEQLLRQAHETRRRLLGPKHSLTLGTMWNLAELYRNCGKWQAAEPLYQNVLDGYREVLGDEHPDTLLCMNLLAELYRNSERPAEAESLYRTALAQSRKVLGDEHLQTLLCMNNLALVLGNLRKYEEAEQLLAEAIAGRRRVLGAEHEYTLGTMCNLGWLYLEWGKCTEAEQALRPALAGYRKTLGDLNGLTLFWMNYFALTLQCLHQYEEAEELFRLSMEGRRQVLGEDHRHTLGTMANLGWLYLEWDRPEQAEPLCQAAVDKAAAVLPAGDRDTALFRSAWGACLTRLKRYAEAEEQLLTSQRELAAWNTGHKHTQRATRLLAELYAAWDAAEPGQGYDVKAAAWRAKLEAWQTSTQPGTTQAAAAEPVAATDGG